MMEDPRRSCARQQELIDLIQQGTLPLIAGKIFTLDEIVEAHRLEENRAGGEIVILT